MWLKRIQLGFLHTGVAIALVPFTSTLNRIMINEMGLAATVVTLLVAVPYLFSPIQIAIGSYADRNPIFGLRRSPYIAFGLLLCIGGAFFAPLVVELIVGQGWTLLTILLSALAFGAWGMGYNFASVSYLSLASELDEEGRSRTIAIMFFMMIVGIIFTAVLLRYMVPTYSLPALQRAFWTVGGASLVLGVLGLIRLEPRTARPITERRYTWAEMYSAVTQNRQGRLFFIYLIVLLAALLGQDVLLEPFGGAVLHMEVGETTSFTSIWGTAMLLTLILAGWLQAKFSKRLVAVIGGWSAMAGLLAIALSGIVPDGALILYAGIVIFGLGTGLSTVSNLSLMLDMTTAENVGLFIGAWGMANAMSRLLGQLMSGIVRDVLTALAGSEMVGYVVVFVIEALFLFISLMLLRRIDVSAFQSATTEEAGSSLVERAALMGKASGD
jgi:MFS transporter, BCD family, chlorophyll transporter